MAKAAFIRRERIVALCLAAGLAGCGAPVLAGEGLPPARWVAMPKLWGRITAHELGLVINTADPYSVAVGEYYARRRAIPEGQVLRVALPTRASLSREEFEAFNEQLRAHMPEQVQALALAWVMPYAVDCNSLTSALGMGLQPGMCSHNCAATRVSPYLSYFGSRPFAVIGMRPAMQLAARSVSSAQAMIERGIAADHSLTTPGAGMAMAYLAATPDAARNVRERLFPPAGRVPIPGVPLEVARLNSDALPTLRRTLIYETGLASVPGPMKGEWLPGALADHLTSNGGTLERPAQDPAQMSALDWIESGATASYGTVSEPCNHLQKFPNPQWLILSYAQGVSAIEAYWRSVAWPGQGVFVGEPLAAPFAAKQSQPAATASGSAS